MAPRNGTTATIAVSAPTPPSPRGGREKPPRSARSVSWRRPRHRSVRRLSSPRRPQTTPTRLLWNQCRLVRPPPPPRPLFLPPRPGRGPQCARGRSCRPSQPRHGPQHAAGAADEPRAGPGRLARDGHGHSGRHGGRQVPRPHQPQPHPREPPNKPYPPKAAFLEGRPRGPGLGGQRSGGARCQPRGRGARGGGQQWEGGTRRRRTHTRGGRRRGQQLQGTDMREGPGRSR